MHPLDTAQFSVRLVAGAIAGATTWLIAADAGNVVVRALRIELPGRALFGVALGYALIGSGVGLLALVHLLSLPIIAACYSCALIVRSRAYWTSARSWFALIRRVLAGRDDVNKWERWAWAATLIGFIIAFCAAALPAVWWDPIAYHLPIVALGLAHHTLLFDAGLPQTGFPLLAEAAALPAYSFAGSAGAAMATLGAGAVLALLCGAVGESLARGSGALATMLVATSALWLWLAPSFYIDVPFALFAVAALMVAWLGRSKPFQAAALSGAFAGAAAATKYPGLFVAVVALAIVLALLPRRIVNLSAFTAGFVLLAGGWYARSFALTGDPIYPFLSATIAFVHSSRTSTSGGNLVQSIHAASPHFCGGGIGFGDLVLLPWRMLTDPKMFCGDPGYAMRLGLVLAIAAIVLLARTRLLIGLAALLTAFWFVTAQQWRFLVDALALIAIVIAVAAISLGTRIQFIVVGTLVALALLSDIVQLTPSTIADASNSLVPAYRYIIGAQSAPDYLRDRLESYAAAEWLAQHDPGAKVFALDDVRDYYFGTNVAWGNSPYPGGRRLSWAASVNERYRGLVNDGFRYMVVNGNPAYTHRTVVDVDWLTLASDERAGALRKVFDRNDVAIYAIVTP